MTFQFTITVDADNSIGANDVRDEVAGSIEDFIESHRPTFSIDVGNIVELARGTGAGLTTIECKAVDQWDGGDRHNFAFYISKDVPDTELKKWDKHCNVRPVTITVFDSLQEVADNSVAKLRKSAWDKLSALERQALGLKDPK